MNNEIIENMAIRTLEASKKAYVPITEFAVGSCIFSEQNHYYTGCNIENSVLSLTMCAEAAAIANMINGGDTVIKYISVVAPKVEECPPCGACRQLILEFSTPTTQILLFNNTGLLRKMVSLAELVPLPFNSSHLSELYT